MKLGLTAGAFGPQAKVNLDLVKHAEALGFDSAWTAEAPMSASSPPMNPCALRGRRT